jgi:hypothetical protein
MSVSPQFCVMELAAVVAVYNAGENISSVSREWFAGREKVATKFLPGPEIRFSDRSYAKSKNHPFRFERWVN